MNRAEFEHVIRAAAGSTGVKAFVVVGSQAVLAILADAPRSLRFSLELDLYPKEYPERSIEIDGAIGELSLFHQTHGIYAHGVSPETAHLPEGWEGRYVKTTVFTPEGDVSVYAPELHDLAFSKLAAGRDKDVAYVRELLRCDLIGRGKLQKLIEGESDETWRRRLTAAWERLRLPSA